MKCDAIFKQIDQAAKKASIPGYDKTVRTVCKSEWAYEVAIVMNDLDSFKAYMDSDFRKNEVLPRLVEVQAAALGEVYFGTRVYDDPL
mmetsp:Transcript_34697/g.79138  ORF Transcript_34697/g.79138 Transcript_34697/m.79138 type:complete len:88 (+) Transcript_34697:206-469(+)